MCATCDAAWERFQRWLDRQSEEVQNLPISQQIYLYDVAE
jgi:hypothetical protein